jgi:mannosyltransferase
MDAASVGMFAFLISIAGAGRPSFWEDEAATISASTRSLSQLWNLLTTVDAVHGLYYLFMHGWFAVFPATEFWSRVPSAMAIGIAAGGVVTLGRRLSTRSVAVTAGIVFAVLPRTTWAGVEARSYALSMAVAVWLTVLCVAAARSNRIQLWVWYALALLVATVLNVFLLLIVFAHLVVVVGLTRSRRTWAGSAVAVGSATALVAPFLVFTQMQRSQVDWIWPVGPGTLGQIVGDQYFPAVYSSSDRVSDPKIGQEVTPELVHAMLVAWGLVAPFILAVAVIAIIAVRKRRSAAEVAGQGARLFVVMSVAWIAVPTLILVLYSVVGEPMYQPHYLAFTAPAMALLIGLSAVVVGRKPGHIAVLVVVLVAAAVPNYAAQRGPYSKFGMDYSHVADLITSEAQPGDCLNVDDTVRAVEPLTSARPQAYAQLRDYGRLRAAIEGNTLYESRLPISSWAHRLDTCQAVWTISERDATVPNHERGSGLSPGPRLASVPAYQVVRDRGFQIVERWQFNLIQVVESTK